MTARLAGPQATSAPQAPSSPAGGGEVSHECLTNRTDPAGRFAARPGSGNLGGDSATVPPANRGAEILSSELLRCVALQAACVGLMLMGLSLS